MVYLAQAEQGTVIAMSVLTKRVAFLLKKFWRATACLGKSTHDRGEGGACVLRIVNCPVVTLRQLAHL